MLYWARCESLCGFDESIVCVCATAPVPHQQPTMATIFSSLNSNVYEKLVFCLSFRARNNRATFETKTARVSSIFEMHAIRLGWQRRQRNECDMFHIRRFSECLISNSWGETNVKLFWRRQHVFHVPFHRIQLVPLQLKPFTVFSSPLLTLTFVPTQMPKGIFQSKSFTK